MVWILLNYFYINLYFVNRYFPGFLDHGNRGGNSNDRENFALLIKELHDKFQQDGYILSVKVDSKIDHIDISYNVSELSKYLDFINLISYDFHGGGEFHSNRNELKTGASAPLHPEPSAIGKDRDYTVEYGIKYWLDQGADPSKIVSLYLNKIYFSF